MSLPDFDWLHQDAYFSGGVSDIPRRDPAAAWRGLRLFVVRNQPVEFPLRMLRRIAAYAGLDVDVEVSEYDDSLGAQAADDVDLTLIWPDWARIDGHGLPIALGRIERRREMWDAFALIPPAEGPLCDHVTKWAREKDITLLDLPVSAETAGGAMRRFSGSELSAVGSLEVARSLLLKALCGHTLPVLKLLVVDLDHTLYRGVIAEDGVQGLVIADEHRLLNAAIEALARSGVLVAIVSRNSQADVNALLEAWPEGLFPREIAVDVIATSGSKGEVVHNLIERFATVPESVMFVDDNPGELLDVVSRCPGVWPVVSAHTRVAASIVNAQHARLRHASKLIAESRRADGRVQEHREAAFASATTMAELHLELGTRVRAWIASEADLERAADLLNRTNQFNTGLQRMDLLPLRQLREQPGGFVAMAQVEDRLADSGVIAVMSGRSEGDVTTVEEFAISCRVLGRSLESVIARCMLDTAPSGSAIRVRYATGPRNAPALKWLARYASEPLASDGHVILDISLLDEAARDLSFVHTPQEH